MIHVSDLSLADIEFLQAVKSINKNPDKYHETDRTEVAANTASIKRATDLTAEQVSYRMGGNQNSRGFEKGDNPLIKTYDPKPTDRGYAPRAVELTEAGWDILSEAQKVGSRLEGVNRDDLAQLRKRIEILEIKSAIQNYLIKYDTNISFCVTKKENEHLSIMDSGLDVSSTLWTVDEDYVIVVATTGEVLDEIAIGKDPTGIADRMIELLKEY